MLHAEPPRRRRLPLARIALVLLALAALGHWSGVAALGVGEIEVHSNLDEPLRAEIELLSPGDANLDETTVSLASPEDFQRVGLERSYKLSRLDFAIGRNDEGRPVIEVTSEDPVSEPFLSFLIELNWQRGRMLREYTVLLDPPVFAPTGPDAQVAATEPGSAEPSAAGPAEPGDSGETPAGGPSAQPRPAEAGDAAQAPGPAQYGPVEQGETLWGVADQVKPEGVTVHQMMLALLRSNPDGFYEDNVNALNQGAVLRVPDKATVQALSREQALTSIREQNSVWERYRRDLAESTPAVAGTGNAPSGAPSDAGESEPTSSELRIVPPGEDDGEGESTDKPGGEGGNEAQVQELRDELARARERLASEEQSNEELSSRVEELEGLVDKLQRAVEVRDNDLAELQAQLAKARERAEEAESEPAAAQGQEPPEDAETTAATEPSDEAPEAGDTSAEQVATAEPGSDSAPAGGSSAAEDTGFGPLALLNHPMTPYAAGGLAVVLLGTLGLAVSRRRNREPAESPLAGMMGDAGSASDSASESEAPVASARTDANDVEALEAAIDTDPQDVEARLRLAEHYYAQRDRASFEAVAEDLQSTLGDGLDDPRWLRVQEMGAELAPDNAMFAPPPSDHPGASPPDAAQSSAAYDAELDEESFDFSDLDLTDIDDSQAETTPAAAGAGSESAGAGGGDAEGGWDLDFDLEDEDTGAAAFGESAGTSETTQGGPDTGEDLSFDFDGDVDDLFTGDAQAEGADTSPASTGETETYADAASDATAADQPFELETVDADATPLQGAGAAESAPAPASQDQQGSGEAEDTLDLDFDLSELEGLLADTDTGDSSEGAQASGEAETQSAAQAGAGEPEDIFDFDLDLEAEPSGGGQAGGGQASGEQAGGGQAERETAGVGGNEGSGTEELDLDLDLAEVPEDSAPSQAGSETQAPATSAAATPGADEDDALELDDEDLFAGDDEVATKLDLARAYLDMGDPEGAKGMLEEIMSEGNDEQRRDAEKLMEEIG